MARAKRQTAKRATKGKGKNPLDPLSLYYAASTAQQLGQYMPSQRQVDRFVRGNPKSISAMTASELNKALDRIDAEGTKITQAFINVGRGNERPSEYLRATDPLAMRARDNYERRSAIKREMDRRYGPGLSGHLPRGFGPLKNPEDIDFLNGDAPLTSTGHLEFTPDGIERFIRGGYVYRAFSNTPVFEDGYRVGAVEGYATEMVPGYAVNPTKFEQRNSRRGRRNPADSSDELYEKFHGVPPNETLSIHEDEHVHGHLAGLGDLVEIVVCLTGGSKAGGTTTLIAPNPNSASDKRIVRVASNEAANQMYLVGGDQKVDVQKLGFRDSFDVTHDGETFEATELKDLMVLGEVQKLTYQTRKAADGFKLIDYYHQLGEDTLVRPFLLYDTMNEKMRIAGGQYHIHGVGVVN